MEQFSQLCGVGVANDMLTTDVPNESWLPSMVTKLTGQQQLSIPCRICPTLTDNLFLMSQYCMI